MSAKQSVRYSFNVRDGRYRYFKMASYLHNSVVRGHHIYKAIWSPELEERLDVSKDHGNPYDRFAVSVIREGQIVGHTPREISRILWSFISKGGSVVCEVTGHRRHGHGLEDPAPIILRLIKSCCEN